MLKFYIDYQNGYVLEISCPTLDDAKKHAEEGMAFTNNSVTILDDHRQPILQSQWWDGVPTGDYGVLYTFGTQGHYQVWEEMF